LTKYCMRSKVEPGMKVGLIGTGAIAHKHAQAYKNIGFELLVCTNRSVGAGRQFADQYRVEFLETIEDVCRDPRIDFVDVCTLPGFRLPIVEACARFTKHIQVQKPIAAELATARRMIDIADKNGILLNVVSQHRFDEASQFLFTAIGAGRLGKLLQCDGYIKWYRAPEYYARPGKGTWKSEGGAALINQGIHQVDLLRWLAGPVREVFGVWQLGALHDIEAEDAVAAVLKYVNGATGVIQASTALWPGYPERIELHGTRGSAIITGDRLTAWDVTGDSGPASPLSPAIQSGASDPMAISLRPFERQFLDFADAINHGRAPLVSGVEGYRTLAVVDAIYRSCRTLQPVILET
jgi:UDP-N-acetyl-2-amino-2-deoxyglucuronate dehydrogenase